MPVPLLNLNRQNEPLSCELKAAFERVLKSGQYILGPEVESLEKKVAALVGAKHAIGVSSGTDAILLALMALDVGPGDEVLCPSFTFFATAGCVARVGATHVFVDSSSSCFNICVPDATRKVTGKTKAVIPVHLFGQAADMAPIMDLAKDHNLFVIEDAAQALGSRYLDKGLGSIGDFGAYSFFPSKNLGGFGDSGMLVCNDDELAEKARLLRTHGSKPKYYHKMVGGNFRMDPLQAALLAVKFEHYASYSLRRSANAAYYDTHLSEIRGIVKDKNVTCTSGIEISDSGGLITLPACHAARDHIWNQYTIRVNGADVRDQLKQALHSAGIGTEIYYPVPMHLQECFTRLETKNCSCPVAKKLSNEVLSLPIFPELNRHELDEVVDAIEMFMCGLAR